MPAPENPVPILDAQTAAFIQRFVSINLASTDHIGRPSVTRVFGCRVTADRHSLTLYISRQYNQAVLENILTTRAIAVVFSRPSTHQTIQIKGNDAQQVALETDVEPLLDAYRDSMIEELQHIGYPPAFSQSLIPPVSCVDTGIRFTPLAIYSQTPGPQAGRKLTA